MDNEDLERREWERVTLRLEPPDYARLADAAHSARLPMAVYCRHLVLGQVPSVAPPAIGELDPRAAELLAICQHLISNLTQLNNHAGRLGGVLQPLHGEGGALEKLGARAREIGLRVRKGDMPTAQIEAVLMRLAEPARNLNDVLARPLNEGNQPELAIWHQALSSVQNGLLAAPEVQGQ